MTFSGWRMPTIRQCVAGPTYRTSIRAPRSTSYRHGQLDRTKRGELRTFPPAGPASFTLAFASCARTGSASDVFDRIRELRPLFYMNMGDFHYLDIRTNSRPRFRAAYDTVLASPQQSELYRQIPFVYMWDDHDFAGNNSDRKSKAHEASRLTYEEYVPHYPLSFAQEDLAICQSFAVGRVKFILTDLRSQRDEPKKKDNAEKSMLGAKQKEWFKSELLAANGKYPLICWVSSVPWIGERGKSPYRLVRTNEFGFIHHTNLLRRTNTAGTVAEAEAAEKAATNETEAAEGNLVGTGEEGTEAARASAGATNKATAAVKGT